MSNRCMTPVTLVVKLVTVLLAFLCSHLGMCLTFSVAMWDGEKWSDLSKIRYAGVCSCQEFLTWATALLCPYSPPSRSLSAQDGYGAALLHSCGWLMIACVLSNPTASLKLWLSPVCVWHGHRSCWGLQMLLKWTYKILGHIYFTCASINASPNFFLKWQS